MTAAVVESSNDGRVSPAHRPDNTSFGPAVGTDGANLNQHAVAVHGGTDKRRWDENIPGKARFQGFIECAGIGDDEAEAIAMHAEASFQHILSGGGVGKGVAVRIHAQELAAGHQAFELPGELGTGLAPQAQFAHQLLEARGLSGLALDFFDDGGIGEHGGGRVFSFQSLQHTSAQRGEGVDAARGLRSVRSIAPLKSADGAVRGRR